MTTLTKQTKSDFNLVIKIAIIRDKIDRLNPKIDTGRISVLETQLRQLIATYKKEFPWKGPTKSMKGYWK